MRTSDVSHEEKYECKKCGKKFRYEAYANRCVCQRCEHCEQEFWTRDMKKHIIHEHPEKHVSSKLDGYKAMRLQCINGMIDFQMKLQIWDETKRMIRIFRVASAVETFFMDDADGAGWGHCGQVDDNGDPQIWSPSSRITDRDATDKDCIIWKILDLQESEECDRFLDAWGVWRQKNNIVTTVEIYRPSS